MVRNNKNFATISAQSLDIRCKTMRLARILRGLVIYYRYFITVTWKFAPGRRQNWHLDDRLSLAATSGTRATRRSPCRVSADTDLYELKRCQDCTLSFL